MDWNFALMSYGNTWRRLRKVFASKLGIRKAFVNYGSIQETYNGTASMSVAQSPEDFLKHLRL